MTRATLTLELLAVLACACERAESVNRQMGDDAPIEAIEPEMSNAELERELDRIEKEIVEGKRAADGSAPPPAPSAIRPKGPPEPEKAGNPGRNKSKNFRNKGSRTNVQRSGSGSS